MKKIKFFVLLAGLVAVAKITCAQSDQSKKIRHYQVKVYAHSQDWTVTGIKVKKNDFVMFEAEGTVDLGFWTKDVAANGSINPLLLVHNRNALYSHGTLLCENGGETIGATTGKILSSDLPLNKYVLPTSIQESFDAETFVGSYFVSKTAQELKFVINDKKIDDNSGFFTVKITVFPLDITEFPLENCPDLSGTFNFAKYVDGFKGQVPFCTGDVCLPKYPGFKNNNGGLWFDGSDKDGHYYLTINPLGPYNDISAAMKILTNNIYYIFPNGAADKALKSNPEKSTLQLGHIYELTYNYNVVYTPEVRVTELSSFHFTFKALEGKNHIFEGTAIHGLFKDKCGHLFMFQQGRGVPDEAWILGQLNLPVASKMWEVMANNMKDFLK